MMIFPEFRRLLKHNAYNGTDHGKANNVALSNGRLQKDKVINAVPNLDDLHGGYLK